ncbi:Ras-related protein Rab-26 [Acromyrmex echinatior]|uniref:Ras-related protein Rab-26 n=1 Tax=Acromyrmex echinatior TaxID=103372 RepID=F4X3M7_ACREC|nr:Ras-related protein Rab-26 [Acromyrmex echinatior]
MRMIRVFKKEELWACIWKYHEFPHFAFSLLLFLLALNFHRELFLHGRISGLRAILPTDLYPLTSPSIHLSDEEGILRIAQFLHEQSTTLEKNSEFKSMKEGLVLQDPSNIDDRDGSANPTTFSFVNLYGLSLHGTSVLRSYFYDGFVTDRVPSFTLPSRLRACSEIYSTKGPKLNVEIVLLCILERPLYIHSVTPREFIPERNANTINNNGSLNFEHESYKNPRESRDTTSECQVQNDTTVYIKSSLYRYRCAHLNRRPLGLLSKTMLIVRFKQAFLDFESMRIDIGWKMDSIFVIRHSFACMVCLQTILLGDSGVGKTSLLVQFDTGRFQPGNFAATVGIGFTVHRIKVTASTNHRGPSLIKP